LEDEELERDELESVLSFVAALVTLTVGGSVATIVIVLELLVVPR